METRNTRMVCHMKVLVTGAAGFIGYHTCLALKRSGHEVVGLDSFNNYYDVNLKRSRQTELKRSMIDVHAMKLGQNLSHFKRNSF